VRLYQKKANLFFENNSAGLCPSSGLPEKILDPRVIPTPKSILHVVLNYSFPAESIRIFSFTVIETAEEFIEGNHFGVEVACYMFVVQIMEVTAHRVQSFL